MNSEHHPPLLDSQLYREVLLKHLRDNNKEDEMSSIKIVESSRDESGHYRDYTTNRGYYRVWLQKVEEMAPGSY